jgi:hypothetical protein
MTWRRRIGLLAGVIVAGVGGVLWGTRTAVAPASAASVTQHRIDGPQFFMEISGNRFISADNPRGWAWPHGLDLERDGWGAIIPHLPEAGSGYTGVILWEITGQDAEIRLCREASASAGCRMAYTSPRTAADGWSKAMHETWPLLTDALKQRGLRLMVYSGTFPSVNAGSTEEPRIIWSPTAESIALMVEDLAWLASMGAQGVGLDTFSYLAEKDPATAITIVHALRTDPRTKGLTLITEGWLPPPELAPTMNRDQRRILLRELAQLELVRGGPDASMTADPNWQRLRLEEDRKLVRDFRGLILTHGANFKPGDLEATVELISSKGLEVLSYEKAAPGRGG